MLEEWILQKAEAEKQRAVGERKYSDWVILLTNTSLEGKGVLYGLNSHNSRLNVVLPVAGPAANTGESPAHVLGPRTWAVLREMSGEHRESIWCAMCSGNHAILCEQRAKEPCKTHSSLLSSSLRLNQLVFFNAVLSSLSHSYFSLSSFQLVSHLFMNLYCMWMVAVTHSYILHGWGCRKEAQWWTHRHKGVLRRAERAFQKSFLAALLCLSQGSTTGRTHSSSPAVQSQALFGQDPDVRLLSHVLSPPEGNRKGATFLKSF